jgi:hypothetical protein
MVAGLFRQYKGNVGSEPRNPYYNRGNWNKPFPIYRRRLIS